MIELHLHGRHHNVVMFMLQSGQSLDQIALTIAVDVAQVRDTVQ